MSKTDTKTNGPETANEDLIRQVRAGETGKTLTASQFGEAWAIAGIMHQTIRKTGTFRDKLTDYAHAFARSERFDALLGETNVRNIFAERYGETMNDLRERLDANQEQLPEQAWAQSFDAAKSITPMIKQGETMPFYQAYDRAGRQLAKTLDITESGAKQLMKETYQEATGKDLYETCKAVEKQYYRAPQSDEPSQARGQSRNQAGDVRQAPRRTQG